MNSIPLFGTAVSAGTGGMNTLILGALIAVYMLFIGYLGYRGFRKTRNSGDYLLAGRSAHPFVMAMSYGAAFISTSALVGFGGIAGQFGMGLMWLVFMNIAIGIVVAFLFFGRRTLGRPSAFSERVDDLVRRPAFPHHRKHRRRGGSQSWDVPRRRIPRIWAGRLRCTSRCHSSIRDVLW